MISTSFCTLSITICLLFSIQSFWTTPSASSIRSEFKKIEKVNYISIVTNLKSLSVNINFFLERSVPRNALASWKMRKYYEMNKMTCSISIVANSAPLRSNINLLSPFDFFALIFFKFLAICRSVWSTRESDQSYFLGRFNMKWANRFRIRILKV